MRPYLRSWWIRAGIVCLVLGTGPLASIMVAASLGLTDDPNPNPVRLQFNFQPIARVNGMTVLGPDPGLVMTILNLTIVITAVPDAVTTAVI